MNWISNHRVVCINAYCYLWCPPIMEWRVVLKRSMTAVVATTTCFMKQGGQLRHCINVESFGEFFPLVKGFLTY